MRLITKLAVGIAAVTTASYVAHRWRRPSPSRDEPDESAPVSPIEAEPDRP